jgi:hypothetical protein
MAVHDATVPPSASTAKFTTQLPSTTARGPPTPITKPPLNPAISPNLNLQIRRNIFLRKGILSSVEVDEQVIGESTAFQAPGSHGRAIAG